MRTILALVVHSEEQGPDRHVQRAGRCLANKVEGDSTKIVVFRSDNALGSIHSLFAGFSPTANFEPEQIRRLGELNEPDEQNFNLVLRIAFEARIGKPPTPPSAVAVIAGSAFVSGFIRHCLAISNGNGGMNIDDFILSPGTLVVIDAEKGFLSLHQKTEP